MEGCAHFPKLCSNAATRAYGGSGGTDMPVELPRREHLIPVVLPDATSTEALTGEPTGPGVERARCIGTIADDCGGVCWGDKSSHGDKDLFIWLARYAAERWVEFFHSRTVYRAREATSG